MEVSPQLIGKNADKEPPKEIIIDKYKGALVGVAVADAFGAPFEFLSKDTVREQFGNIKDLVGGGVFKWAPGEFTDDTDQTLAIVDSLIEKDTYDPQNIADGFLKWYQKGPKDVGTTTASSLDFLSTGVSYKEAGLMTFSVGGRPTNGSLMRTAPLGLYFAGFPDMIDKSSAEVSAITHAHPDCVLACQIASHIVADLISGSSKNDIKKNIMDYYKDNTYATQRLNQVFKGERITNNIGDVFDTLAVGVHAFMQANSFEGAVISAVFEGGDTDTQAAVTGAMAGAYWGINAIPQRWKEKVNPISSVVLEKKGEILYSLNQGLRKK